MISKTFDVVLASVPDREDLVAEIWVEGRQFGEVRRDGDDLVVDVFPNLTAPAWEIRHRDLIDLLQVAREKLSGATSWI